MGEGARGVSGGGGGTLSSSGVSTCPSSSAETLVLRPQAEQGQKQLWASEIFLPLSPGQLLWALCSLPTAWKSCWDLQGQRVPETGARDRGRGTPSPAAAFAACVPSGGHGGVALSSIGHSRRGTSSLWNSPAGGGARGAPGRVRPPSPHPQGLCPCSVTGSKQQAAERTARTPQQLRGALPTEGSKTWNSEREIWARPTTERLQTVRAIGEKTGRSSIAAVAVIRLSRRVVVAAFITREFSCNGTTKGRRKEKKGFFHELRTCKHFTLINSLDPICSSERLSPSSRVTQQGQSEGALRAGPEPEFRPHLIREGVKDKTQKALRGLSPEDKRVGSGW